MAKERESKGIFIVLYFFFPLCCEPTNPAIDSLQSRVTLLSPLWLL